MQISQKVGLFVQGVLIELLLAGFKFNEKKLEQLDFGSKVPN